MNLLYLHTHDLGRFIGPHGHAVATPHLQRLAEEGTLFRQAFCVAPTCSPSRAALLTGRYPHEVGLLGLASPASGWCIDDPEALLPGHLRRQGYHTAIAGVHHIGELPWFNPGRLPYDEFLNHTPLTRRWNNWLTADRAAEFLRRPHSGPWMLDVGFDDPHRHWHGEVLRATAATQGLIDGRFTQPLVGLPDTPETRTDTATLARCAQFFDSRIGQVLTALDESGQAASTLVLITTDHGPGFPGMKCHLRDAGTGVFLLLCGPGVPAGRVVDEPASHLDVFPTVCAALGLPVPDGPPRRGISWWPTLQEREQPTPRTLFFEQCYHGKPRVMRAVRTARHKYIRYFGPPTTWAEMDTDGGPSFEVLRAAGRDRQVFPEKQLYDLRLDPLEHHNLADDPTHRATQETLEADLERWMQDTGDPLLLGPLPPEPASLQLDWEQQLSPELAAAIAADHALARAAGRA